MVGGRSGFDDSAGMVSASMTTRPSVVRAARGRAQGGPRGSRRCPGQRPRPVQGPPDAGEAADRAPRTTRRQRRTAQAPVGQPGRVRPCPQRPGEVHLRRHPRRGQLRRAVPTRCPDHFTQSKQVRLPLVSVVAAVHWSIPGGSEQLSGAGPLLIPSSRASQLPRGAAAGPGTDATTPCGPRPRPWETSRRQAPDTPCP